MTHVFVSVCMCHYIRNGHNHYLSVLSLFHRLLLRFAFRNDIHPNSRNDVTRRHIHMCIVYTVRTCTNVYHYFSIFYTCSDHITADQQQNSTHGQCLVFLVRQSVRVERRKSTNKQNRLLLFGFVQCLTFITLFYCK